MIADKAKSTSLAVRRSRKQRSICVRDENLPLGNETRRTSYAIDYTKAVVISVPGQNVQTSTTPACTHSCDISKHEQVQHEQVQHEQVQHQQVQHQQVQHQSHYMQKANQIPTFKTNTTTPCVSSVYKSTFIGATMAQPSHSFQPKEPMFQHMCKSNSSTYKDDYLQPNLCTFNTLQEQVFVPNFTKPNELSTHGAPGPKQSTYGETYIDYKLTFPHMTFSPSQLPTTDCRLPFIGHASNKEYGRFRSQDVTMPEDGHRFAVPQLKNPICVDMKLPGMHQSLSREAFQPFKRTEAVKRMCPVDVLGPDTFPCFKNQFKTSSSVHEGRQNLMSGAKLVLNRSKTNHQSYK